MCVSPKYVKRDYQIVDGEYILSDKRSFLNYETWNILKSQISETIVDGVVYGSQFFTLPCKQCIQCRLQKSRMWADRLVCESSTSSSSYFITLTYDDEHLPFGKPVKDMYGNVLSPALPSLSKNDFRAFNKRLRRYFEYHFGVRNIRFYCGAEYGDKSARPHYHVIYFNLPIPDLKKYKNNFNGDVLYTSKILEDIWGKGFVVIASMSWQSAAYVSRYVVKKRNGAQSLELLGIENQWQLCSNKPGIGREFYEQNKDKIYENDELFIPGRGATPPPAYFDKLYDADRTERMYVIKEHRVRKAQYAQAHKLDYTDLSEPDYLDVIKSKLENINKKLPRSLD